MEDSVADDGQPLYFGDVITLYSTHHQGFMVADGFNSTELIFKKCPLDQPDISCQWKVMSKLNYEQQKRMKKLLKHIGVEDFSLYADVKEEREVSKHEDETIMKRAPLVDKEKEINKIEEERIFGTAVLYGANQPIQLKHIKSGKFLSLSKQTARQPGTSLCQVIDNGDEGSWFIVVPGFKVRKEGEAVRVTDQLTLRNFKKPLTLHINSESMGKCTNMQADESEIHGWEEPTEMEKERDIEKQKDSVSKFVVHRYSRFDDGQGVSICSGSFVRLTHREDEAYMRFGDVTRPIIKNDFSKQDNYKYHRNGHKLHLHSTMPERDSFGVARTSSNAVWEVIQTDQTDIDSLNEKMRRQSKNPDTARVFPKACGGNITWEKLFRFKHVGTGKYLAASFASSGQKAKATDQKLRPQYIRFYLANLSRKKEDGALEQLPGAHIETLFKIAPVNACDAKLDIKSDDVFHLQHAVSGHWMSARTDADENPEYYPQDAEEAASGNEDENKIRKFSPFRQIQLVAEWPYKDAFVFQPVKDDLEPDCEVKDINMILTVIPELRKYVAEYMFTQKYVDTAITQKISSLLGKLIVEFITYQSQDRDPLTREGLVRKGRRQQLMREQGLLDLLVQISKAEEYIQKDEHSGGFVPGGLTYFMLQTAASKGKNGANGRHKIEGKFLEDDRADPKKGGWAQVSSLKNIHSLCKLANRLMRFALVDNAANCQYMIQFIDVYRDQIGAGLFAIEILQVLHKDRADVLEKLPSEGFHQWVKKIPESINERNIPDILSVPARFLSLTCMCYNAESKTRVPVRKNQDAIAKYLFRSAEDEHGNSIQLKVDNEGYKTDENGDRVDQSIKFGVQVIDFIDEGSVLSVMDVSRYPPQPRTLEDIFKVAPGDPDAEFGLELQRFIVRSVELYANLCAGNKDIQNIVGTIMPEDVLLTLITKDRDSSCDELRAAACELLYRLYIDADGKQQMQAIQRTRKFEDVNEAYSHKLVLRDDIPFAGLKLWTVDYLSATVRMRPRSSNAFLKNNHFVVAILQLVFNLLRFGVYTDLAELECVLRPILAILDSATDIPDPEAPDPPEDATMHQLKTELRPLKLSALCKRLVDGGNSFVGMEQEALDLLLKDPALKTEQAKREKVMQLVLKQELCKSWRYENIGGNSKLIEAKLEICRILGFVQDMALNLRITKVLLSFRRHLDTFRNRKAEKGTVGSKQLQTLIMSGSKLKICPKSWPAVLRKLKDAKEMFELLDFGSAHLRTMIVPRAGASFMNDLFELTLYKEDALVAEVYKVMAKQFNQRESLGIALKEVQLLCSKADVGFFQLAKSMLSGLHDFLKSDHGPHAEKKVTEQLYTAVDELDKNAKTVDERQARQRLFMNVEFPHVVIEMITKTLELSDEDKQPPMQDPNKTTPRTRLPLFNVAYLFLYHCCRGNIEMKNDRVFANSLKIFIQHLDIKPKISPEYARMVEEGRMPPYIKVDVGAETLVMELYEDNPKLVQAITSEEIKNFVSLLVNNGRHPHLLQFLNMLAVVGSGDDGRPVKRNQALIIKGLIQNKMKTMSPSLYKTEEEWQVCLDLMDDRKVVGELQDDPPPAGGLKYHAQLIDLLYRCARGKNKAAEQLCQAELPLSAIRRGLCDERTIPLVKRAYLNFMWESYIELERPKRATPISHEIWPCLKKLAKDLSRSQLTMVSVDIKPGYVYTEVCVREEIQYLYRDAMTFLSNWFSTQYRPLVWDETEKKMMWAVNWISIPEERRKELVQIATDLLDGVCTLLERTAIPACQIGIRDTENGYKCVKTMMFAGVQPSDSKRAVAESFRKKGEDLEDSVDPFAKKQGIPPQDKLIQLAFGMLAKDFHNAIDPDEELVGLADLLRNLIQTTTGVKCLVYGDRENKDPQLSEPEKYVRAIVDHLTGASQQSSSAMPVAEEVQKALLGALKLVLFPRRSGRSHKAIERWNAEVISLQNSFCSPLLRVHDMICTMIADKLTATEKFATPVVMKLLRQLLYNGNEFVQDKLYEELSPLESGEYKRCEKFFDHLESRMTLAKTEVKAGKTFHALQEQQERTARELEARELGALGGEKPDKAQMAIDAAMEPPKEVNEEYALIEDILQIMKDLCEDDNQPGKKLLKNQKGSSRVHDLALQAVQYTEAWSRSIDRHNVGMGSFAFRALTELVIGPCEETQEMLGSELKMDMFNELFEIDYHTTKLNKIQLRDVQVSAVRCLQAMLEGNSSSQSRKRCIKTLKDLKRETIEAQIIIAYSDWIESQSAKAIFMRHLMGMPPFDKGRLELLAMLYMTLLRQLHDSEQDDRRPAPPLDFMKTLIGQDRYIVNTNQKKGEVLKEEQRRARAEDALKHVYSTMARIEITRKPRSVSEAEEAETRIERVYFARPPMTYKLTEETKAQLVWNIPRTSGEEKLRAFMMQADDFLFEMILQEKLNRQSIYMFFDKRREFWKAMSWYTTGFINIVLIVFTDHEDKYDDDPTASFDVKPGSEKLGTPINILDIDSVPVERWQTMYLFQGKVAYIPQMAFEALEWLGLFLMVYSAISWGLFVAGFGPIVARSGFKTRHQQRETELRLADSSYEEVPFSDKVYMSKRGSNPLEWPLFYAKKLWYICTDSRFLYNMWYMVTVMVGYFLNKFFYCALLFSILQREPDLMSALNAVLNPLGKIVKVLMLTFIAMYIFTVIAFSLFHDHLNDGENKEDNMCNSILQCITFTIYNGLIGSEMWYTATPADLWPTGRYAVDGDEETQNIIVFVIRVFNDILFFLMIGVILVNGVIFGLILDEYTSLRVSGKEKTDEQQNECFICRISRSDFDTDGNGFNSHYKDDHNMWNYIYFIVHLHTLDKTEYNGPEAYVDGLRNIDKGGNPYNCDWLPQDAMVLQRQEVGEENIDAIQGTVNGIQDDVMLLAESSKLRLKHLEDCKVTAKLVEQSLIRGEE